MVGYVDSTGRDFGLGSGPRTPFGLPRYAKPGNLTGNDTGILGSGTKPYTAAGAMRLVDQGKVSLDDKASIHLDGPMKAMWNTSFVGLFGVNATNVTVGNILRMQSGLADMDNSKYEAKVLVNETHGHSPLEDLQYVANLTGPFGCKNRTCTWAFEPGAHTQYSSTNYLLAGLILINHAPEGQQTW